MQGLLVPYAPLCYLVDNQKYQFMKQNCRSISVYVDRRNGLSVAENTQSVRQFVPTQSATSSMKAVMACHSSYFSNPYMIISCIIPLNTEPQVVFHRVCLPRYKKYLQLQGMDAPKCRRPAIRCIKTVFSRRGTAYLREP